MMNFLIFVAGMALGSMIGMLTAAFLYSVNQRLHDLRADSGITFTPDFDPFEPPLKLIKEEEQ